MENKPSNREKIFYSALRLFAEKGYSNVTMREIAKDVNIKAASIYNHYSGKEDILDSIADYFKKQLLTEIYHVIDASNPDIYIFWESFSKANNDLFSKPIVMDISKIILTEQFQNKKIRLLLLQELIQKPREAFTNYFQQLMDLGKMRRIDPVLAAKEFQAYFIYRFYENSLNLENDQADQNNEEEEQHIQQFINHYFL